MFTVTKKGKFKKACESNDLITVKRMIDDGFDVNSVHSKFEGRKYNLGGIALRELNYKLLKILIDSGIKEIEMVGATPFSLAITGFVESGSKDKEGFKKSIKLLLKSGIAINLKDKSGHTLLMYTASINDYGLTKYIIGLGADKHIEDNKGKSAFDHTESNRIKALLSGNKTDKALLKDGWEKLDKNRIALIKTDKALERTVTEEFNFKSGYITTTIRNLVTDAESSFILDMHGHRDIELLEKALKHIGTVPKSRLEKIIDPNSKSFKKFIAIKK